MARNPNRARLGRVDNTSLEIVATLDRRGLARLKLLARASTLEAAKALTFTAERAVPAWRLGHRGVFHQRRDWIDKGVRMRPATPGNLSAKVGSIDAYMQRHVVGMGETKRASPGKRLFIPMYGRVAEVGTHTQVRRKLKSADRTKRKTFLLRAASGAVFIARRKGKARTPLQILGKLDRRAEITPRLNAGGIVSGVVSRHFGPIYERLLIKWASKN